MLDETGSPVIGATVKIKGTNVAAVTDLDGNFQLEAPEGSQLEVTYLGYGTKVVAAAGEVTVKLTPDEKVLAEVVVTALGIKRSERALSYNVQKVSSDKLTTVKEVNFVNSLNGTVAGVNINASTTGVGGPTRVVMRGTKSITGGNGVLYVIDGIPMVNPNGGDIGGGKYSSQPSGEGIADINPEDIESITYSTSAEFSRPFILPEFQNTYGNQQNSFKSWGDKLDTPSNVNPEDFFKTGHNYVNAVTLTTGTKTNRTFVSVAATNADGILTNNEYDRYNFTVRNTADFLKDKLHLDVSGSYIIQKTQNMYRPGEYYNPLLAVYLFPRGENWNEVELYKRYDPVRRFPVQYWPYGDQGMQLQNPYFVVNDMMQPSKRKRYMFAAA